MEHGSRNNADSVRQNGTMNKASRIKKRRNKVLQKIKNDTIFILFKFMLVFAKVVPLKIGMAIGSFMGKGAFLFLVSERQKTLDHLELAFPEKDEKWRYETGKTVFMNLGISFFELGHLDDLLLSIEGKGKNPGYITFVGREYLDKQLEGGRGGLFALAHIDNWELMAASIAKAGYPANEVVRKLYDPRIDKILNDHRTKYNYRPIMREGKAAIPEIIRIFQENEFIGLLMDQDTKVRGVFAPFFGHLAHTPSGPAYLAYQTDFDMIPIYMARNANWGHTITVYPPIPRPKTGDSKKDIFEYTCLLNNAVEEKIRKHPTEWVWMHKRWKTRPEGEAPEMVPVISRSKIRGKYKYPYVLFSFLAPRLSWAKVESFGKFLGRSAVGVGLWRDEAKNNISLTFNEKTSDQDWKLLYENSLENLSRNYLTRFRAAKMNADYFKEKVKIKGAKEFEKETENGQGAILLCGHIGSSELGLGKLAENGREVLLASNPIKPGYLNKWLVWARRKIRIFNVPINDNLENLCNALERGATVAFSIDEAFSTHDGVEVEYLSRKHFFSSVLSKSAMRTGAPVFIVHSKWQKGGEQVFYFDKRVVLDKVDKDEKQAVKINTEIMIREFEKIVKNSADIYIWTR